MSDDRDAGWHTCSRTLTEEATVRLMSALARLRGWPEESGRGVEFMVARKNAGPRTRGTTGSYALPGCYFCSCTKTFCQDFVAATCSLDYFRIRKCAEPRIAGGNDTCFWLHPGPVLPCARPGIRYSCCSKPSCMVSAFILACDAGWISE